MQKLFVAVATVLFALSAPAFADNHMKGEQKGADKAEAKKSDKADAKKDGKEDAKKKEKKAKGGC